MHSSIAVALADISPFATTAALAQTVDPDQQVSVQGQLAGIIMTAQRREQSPQKVPVAVIGRIDGRAAGPREGIPVPVRHNLFNEHHDPFGAPALPIVTRFERGRTCEAELGPKLVKIRY